MLTCVAVRYLKKIPDLEVLVRESWRTRRSSGAVSGHMMVPPNMVPDDIDVTIRNQQAAAQAQLAKQSRVASTAISLIFRKQTAFNAEVTGRLLSGADGTQGINWDNWYARVAKLSEPLISQEVEASGGPGGTNTVSLTITADHHISVRLLSGGSAPFDAAIIRAYRKLDNNKSLAFPAGSRRKEVTFLADTAHDAPGVVSTINTQTFVGDRE